LNWLTGKRNNSVCKPKAFLFPGKGKEREEGLCRQTAKGVEKKTQALVFSQNNHQNTIKKREPAQKDWVKKNVQIAWNDRPHPEKAKTTGSLGGGKAEIEGKNCQQTFFLTYGGTCFVLRGGERKKR